MNKKEYTEYKQILESTILPKPISEEESQKVLQPLNDWIAKYTPAKLFKFRACNENNIQAFLNQQIWFATASKMNDDFDSLLYCDTNRIRQELDEQFDTGGNLKLYNYLKAGGEIPERFIGLLGKLNIQTAKENLKRLSDDDLHKSSVVLKQYLEKGFNDQCPFVSEIEQRVVKFSSFSEDIKSPLMWGHYADNSTGFALAYDFRNGEYNECKHCDKLGVSCFLPKFHQLLPVVYSDAMLDSTDYARYLMQDAITKGYLKNFNLEPNLYNKILDTVTCRDVFMHTKILFQKSTAWIEEKEWRMTISYNAPSYQTDQVANVLKKPCALYLGRRINKINEQVLRSIAYKHNIPVYKMTIDKMSLKFMLKPVRQKNSKKDLKF